MYRSTTPELIFHITNKDFDMADIDICHVTVMGADNLHTIIYKNPEIDTENKTIKQFMTQAETAAFNVGSVLTQVKIKLNNGSVICSPVIVTDMKEILEVEEL